MSDIPQSAEDSSAHAMFELKAASFTLPVIRLLGSDMDAVSAQLGPKVEQAPDFFRNTPVVVDLGGLPEGSGDVEFPLLVGLMRGFGMIPIGVRGGSPAQNAAAQAMELAVLGETYNRRSRPPMAEQGANEPTAPAGRAAAPAPEPDPQRPSAAANAARAHAEGKTAVAFELVTRPVRSGQRVYAAGGDLSVIAPVSSGAELMADGNIHVYGPLRGRAMAGMQGDAKARIFCQDLQAELISVAGHYRVSENIPEDLRGVPVQIYLDQKVLRIEKL